MNQVYTAAFAAALVPRLLYLVWRWSIIPHWNADAIGYNQLALNLLQHHVFSLRILPPIQPDALRTPAYPLLIAGLYASFGQEPHIVLLTQAILDSLAAVLMASMVARITQSRRAALFAGLLYALLPTAWRYCAEFYTETVLAFAFALLFWQFARLRSDDAQGGAWLGATCALCMLIKPNVIVLPVILVATLIAIAKRSWRGTVMFAIVVAIGVLPWMIRNAVVFHRFMLSNVFENNLARVSGPATYAEANGLYVIPWTAGWDDLYFVIIERAQMEQPQLLAIPEKDMTPLQLDQAQIALANVARSIIIAHPRAFIESHIKGALRGLIPLEHQFWFAQFTGKTWDTAVQGGIWQVLISGRWRTTSRLALAMFMVIASAVIAGWTLALIGLAWLFRRRTALACALAAVIAYVFVLPGPISHERFHVPVLPLMCALAAIGMWRLIGPLFRRH